MGTIKETRRRWAVIEACTAKTQTYHDRVGQRVLVHPKPSEPLIRYDQHNQPYLKQDLRFRGVLAEIRSENI